MSKIPTTPIIKPEAVSFEPSREQLQIKELLARRWKVEVRPTGLKSGRVTFTRRF